MSRQPGAPFTAPTAPMSRVPGRPDSQCDWAQPHGRCDAPSAHSMNPRPPSGPLRVRSIIGWGWRRPWRQKEEP